MVCRWMLRVVVWACALCLAGGGVAACQKVELPSEEKGTEQASTDLEEETPGGDDYVPGVGDDEPSEDDGEWVSAHTVAKMQEMYAGLSSDNLLLCEVVGYIVGYTSGNTIKNAVFGAGEGAAATNILIADDKGETDVERCLPVQLEDNYIREELNLRDNPDNLGWRIYLVGYASKYFSVVGLRNVEGYEWVEGEEEQPDDTPDVPESPDNPEPEMPEEARDTIRMDDTPELIPGGRSV